MRYLHLKYIGEEHRQWKPGSIYQRCEKNKESWDILASDEFLNQVKIGDKVTRYDGFDYVFFTVIKSVKKSDVKNELKTYTSNEELLNFILKNFKQQKYHFVICSQDSNSQIRDMENSKKIMAVRDICVKCLTEALKLNWYQTHDV